MVRVPLEVCRPGNTHEWLSLLVSFSHVWDGDGTVD